MTDETIINEASVMKYFGAIPHMVGAKIDLYAHRLYCHYVEVCGINQSSTCTQAEKTIYTTIGMSKQRFHTARQSLIDAGFITFIPGMPNTKGEKGYAARTTIIDVWAENIAFCQARGKNIPLEGEDNYPLKGQNITPNKNLNNLKNKDSQQKNAAAQSDGNCVVCKQSKPMPENVVVCEECLADMFDASESVATSYDQCLSCNDNQFHKTYPNMKICKICYWTSLELYKIARGKSASDYDSGHEAIALEIRAANDATRDVRDNCPDCGNIMWHDGIDWICNECCGKSDMSKCAGCKRYMCRHFRFTCKDCEHEFPNEPQHHIEFNLCKECMGNHPEYHLPATVADLAAPTMSELDLQKQILVPAEQGASDWTRDAVGNADAMQVQPNCAYCQQPILATDSIPYGNDLLHEACFRDCPKHERTASDGCEKCGGQLKPGSDCKCSNCGWLNSSVVLDVPAMQVQSPRFPHNIAWDNLKDEAQLRKEQETPATSTDAIVPALEAQQNTTPTKKPKSLKTAKAKKPGKSPEQKQIDANMWEAVKFVWKLTDNAAWKITKFRKFFLGTVKNSKADKRYGEDWKNCQLDEYPATPHEVVAFGHWYRNTYDDITLPEKGQTLLNHFEGFRGHEDYNAFIRKAANTILDKLPKFSSPGIELEREQNKPVDEAEIVVITPEQKAEIQAMYDSIGKGGN